MESDKFREECGVFGVFDHPEAANLVYLGLYALQHRGQEGAGITSSDGKAFHNEKGLGLVADIFSEKKLKRLPGRIAIGHNRYSTAGGGGLKNVQPIVANFSLGSLAIAHNGTLINADQLRDRLEEEGHPGKRSFLAPHHEGKRTYRGEGPLRHTAAEPGRP
jgi:amidophosphoribosyltransferase